MKTGKIHAFLLCVTALCAVFFTGVSSAQTPPAGEEELFTASTAPDALLLFDLSGSMDWNPPGGSNKYGNTSCSGTTFYSDTSHTGYTTDCRRIAIAKRTVFNVLEDTGDSTINSSDRTALGVRFGYMRFRNCGSGSKESGSVYGSTAACTADTVNCAGSNCSDGFCNTSIPASTYYVQSSCSTPDTVNCSGPACGRTDGFCSSQVNTNSYYASATCGTADTFNCAGTGCSNGFCDNTHSIASYNYYASTDCNASDTSNCTGTGCSNGFCDSTHPKTGSTYYAHAYCNTPDRTNCSGRTWSGCSGGFCNSSHSGGGKTCTVACTNPGCSLSCTSPGCTVHCPTAACTTACTSIGCTQSCPGSGSQPWTDGCNTLIAAIDTLYSCIYCSDLTSCSTTTSCNTGTNKCSNANCVVGETATGGTHVAAALGEAKAYLDAHKLLDASGGCRKKFVIMITDGDDTLACNGTGSEGQSDMYKRRRESVARAKALAEAGYKVFMIGFGASMPKYLQNTLNWMAFYGGTDNPNAENSGSTSSYNIAAGAANLYPSGITSCVTSTKAATACDDSDGATGAFTDGGCAASNDPATAKLSGYAFLATDADELDDALRTAVNLIREATYSFTQASVQSSRTSDENYIYEASFEPVTNEPFWHGHLKKYPIDNTTGEVGTLINDAADVLQARDDTGTTTARTMYTCVGCTGTTGTLTSFTTSIDPTYFGFTTTATSSRDAVVGYIRGQSAYNPDSTAGVGVFKLGDVFRSTPITVGTPSAYFDDIRDQYASTDCTTIKTSSAFTEFRTNHCRASSCTGDGPTKRLIVAGANDGQIHAFHTSDLSEAWSFIPPNLLFKLTNIAHSTHPTTLSHQYFVDGPVTVADVWLGTGTGKCKSSSDWKTLMVFGEGRGTTPNTWSSSQYCDSDFSSTSKYSATYPFYCGYYALDITSSLAPTFKWHLIGAGTNGAMNGTTDTYAPYLGEAWSKVMTGKVMYTDSAGVVTDEKWVGFVGGGYNGSTCTATTCGTSCDCRGKSFYVVDLKDGKILWSFILGDGTGTTSTNMKYSIPGDASIVDTDNDGFIDTVYIGDLGGNIWRFKFCTAGTASCNTASWTGRRLFNGTSITTVRPVYTGPAVARDGAGNLWVYWGTGDKNDPINNTYTDRLFALKDGIPKGDSETATSPYGISNMADISSCGATTCTTYDNTDASASNKGYYISLPGTGEKILSDATVFGGILYFTTYTPPTASSTTCNQEGNASLYAISYTSGAGAFSGSGSASRSKTIGTGIPSAPVISMKPGGSSVADLYVTVSSGFVSDGTSTGKNTGRVNFNPPGMSNRTNILYWKDMRIQ